MAKLIVHQDKIENIQELINICPFGALQETDGKVEITAACKMCKLCVKKGPKGAVEFVEEAVQAIDKSKWKGIAVYVDHTEGEIHPVTYELIGKARELAQKIHQPVYAIFMGSGITDKSHVLSIQRCSPVPDKTITVPQIVRQKEQKPEAPSHSKKFRIGDSVIVYPQKEIGIVYACSNDKGEIGVQVKEKKMLINHKRIKLHAVLRHAIFRRG